MPTRILVIDDEQVVLDTCTQILEGGDVEVATALDGARGLALLEQIRPDLVFVDLQMPGISGLEVLRKIREVDPTVVTIVISEDASVSSAVDAMKQGAYDFLPKPFTPDEFRLITQRGLEKRRMVLEAAALRGERERLREHFAAIVSHELKAPLSAVQQNLFALRDELSGRLGESQQRRLERVIAQVDGLVKLIHTWLGITFTDFGALRARFRPTSLAEVISRAREAVQPYAARKDVAIDVRVDEPLPWVEGDEGTLTEAIVNLLHNAVKYSRGGSRVFLEARSDGQEVLVSVSDRGVGIAEEDLPFLFEDFYVGRTGPPGERPSGRGLGLALTRRIVEAHGGTICADSQLGRGSTFTIRLPARPEAPWPAEEMTETTHGAIR